MAREEGNNAVLQLIWIKAKSNEIISRIKDIERVNLRSYTYKYLRKLIPVYQIYINSDVYEIMVILFIAIIIMFQLSMGVSMHICSE